LEGKETKRCFQEVVVSIIAIYGAFQSKCIFYLKILKKY